jgi:hypothetical protein
MPVPGPPTKLPPVPMTGTWRTFAARALRAGTEDGPMGRERWAAMVGRRLGDTPTRRSALGGALLAVTAAAIPLSDTEVLARKNGRKKRKKKCPSRRPRELSCQEACPGTCSQCLHRKADSILCGSGFEAGLQACSSDNDCIGVRFGDITFPYCLTQTEDRDTGRIQDIGNGAGVCTNILVCAGS